MKLAFIGDRFIFNFSPNLSFFIFYSMANASWFFSSLIMLFNILCAYIRSCIQICFSSYQVTPLKNLSPYCNLNKAPSPQLAIQNFSKLCFQLTFSDSSPKFTDDIATKGTQLSLFWRISNILFVMNSNAHNNVFHECQMSSIYTYSQGKKIHTHTHTMALQMSNISLGRWDMDVSHWFISYSWSGIFLTHTGKSVVLE